MLLQSVIGDYLTTFLRVELSLVEVKARGSCILTSKLFDVTYHRRHQALGLISGQLAC